MTISKYPFYIEWSDEDQEYMVTCPAFPGLSAFGESEEEALKEAKIVLKGFIQTHKDRGIPLPQPMVAGAFSGKLQLRIEKSLHRLSVQMAQVEKVSLNTYIANALQARLAGEQAGSRILNEVRTALASGLTVRATDPQYTETRPTRKFSVQTRSSTQKTRSVKQSRKNQRGAKPR
ncbi:MAG TPA: type II toxin-antitoxin system HicB family antitoxin [Pyrinomonadaceae bacterium]